MQLAIGDEDEENVVDVGEAVAAGVCGMAELTATSKTELQRMGVLPGHAN